MIRRRGFQQYQVVSHKAWTYWIRTFILLIYGVVTPLIVPRLSDRQPDALPWIWSLILYITGDFACVMGRQFHGAGHIGIVITWTGEASGSELRDTEIIMRA